MSDDTVKVATSKGLAKPLHVLAQTACLEGTSDAEQQMVEIQGFGEKVVGPLLEGFDRL
jgi:hypothetical protein